MTDSLIKATILTGHIDFRIRYEYRDNRCIAIGVKTEFDEKGNVVSVTEQPTGAELVFG